MYTAEDKLKFCATTITAVLADLRVVPEKIAVMDLIAICNELDERYKACCTDVDNNNGLEAGTTYRDGLGSLDFYIDGEAWHKISLALRALKPKRTVDEG